MHHSGILNVLAFSLAAVLISNVAAVRFCKSKDDCNAIGSLECIKSYCDWGFCACPRGQIARYLGSESLFKCVDQKKVGEKCSFDGEDGVCGAPDSACTDGTCTCRPGYDSRFGGEICLSYTNIYPSEMVSGEASSCVSPSGLSPNSILLVGTPRSCMCQPGYQTGLPNIFDNDFQGKKIPKCIPLKIGDTCTVDDDCKNILGVTVCRDNKCACNNSGEVSNIEGNRCDKPLAFGANCSVGGFPVTGICDGSKGLACGGNVCDLTPNRGYKTCDCHFTRNKNGGSCAPRSVGSTCYGDNNCKGINMNAICEEGKCKNGAVTLSLSLVFLWTTLLQYLL